MKRSFIPSILVLAALTAASCGPGKEEPRTETFPSVDAPVRISDRAPGLMVRDSTGRLVLVTFIHSTFPSAVDEHEAFDVLESKDDGDTWRRIGGLSSFVTYSAWGYDLRIDSRDRLYLAWVASVFDAEARRPSKSVLVARSDDGGATWTEPAAASSARFRQLRAPAIAVHQGRVCVAWLDDRRAKPRDREDVFTASSADAGATWSADRPLGDAFVPRIRATGAPALCVAADGTVCCAFPVSKPARGGGTAPGVCVAASADGGQTFATRWALTGPVGEVTLAAHDEALYMALSYSTAIKRIAPSPEVAQDVRLFVSDDGGKTWDKGVTVTDGRPGGGKRRPRLLFLDDDRVLACWVEGRGGVWLAASVDGGRHWGLNAEAAPLRQIGASPLAVTPGHEPGTFRVCASVIRKGPGDAVYLIRGRVQDTD